jgi:hypothetical protein
VTPFALNADGGLEIRIHRQHPADRNPRKQKECATEINCGEGQRRPLKAYGIESGDDGQGQREQRVQSYDDLIEASGFGLHFRTGTNDAGIRALGHGSGDGDAAGIPGKVDPGAPPVQLSRRSPAQRPHHREEKADLEKALQHSRRFFSHATRGDRHIAGQDLPTAADYTLRLSRATEEFSGRSS